MTNKELKALVKEYFNLTEIKMGEIYDENKAFKIVFEGDKLELGMKVMVVTAEGQEMDAPDGYHKLEDGSMIKTEGSVVTEITSASEEAKEEELAELPVEEFPVEVSVEDQSKVAEETSAMPQMMAEEDKTTVEDIVSAVAEVVKREIEDVKAEMGKMKEKMEKMSAEPAAAKTLPNTKMSATSANNAVDPVRFEMMKKLISNKINK